MLNKYTVKMKNKTIYIFAIAIIILSFYSCTSTNELTISVTEPAPVYISSDIKKIGIINRSEPTDITNKNLDGIDKILSAEGITFDEEGANKTVMGLFDELSMYNKFEEIVLIRDADTENTGLGIFPSALSWDDIDRICYENNVDAIVSLSFYDTDTEVDYKSSKTKIDNPFGKDIPALSHDVTVTTEIKTGWRVYNPNEKLILDEYIVRDKIISRGNGINPLKAVEAIVGRKDAVMDISTSIGKNYAFRLLPYRTRVTRLYYVKGNDNFEKAKRMAQTGNWNDAAELWKKEVNNPDGEIAGRACYNMAIINEINGDLEKAVEWASKAYTEYENKNALKYVKILKNRINKNKILEN